MMYSLNGDEINTVYDVDGDVLVAAYDIDGNQVSGDYDHYDTDYQRAILDARNAWAAQYRSAHDVIPLIVHTDQHGRFVTTNPDVVALFQYLGHAVKWNEVSAMVGLGDVDLPKNNYPQMTAILNGACPKTKRIDIWGNHDLWQNMTTVDGQYVVDFDTVYPQFNNESYGDVSHAYNHKGIEYHIDSAHGVKYCCLAGWEIDSSLGGHSHYVIGQESMAGIIDMLEANDGYDIVLLCHTNPWNTMSKCYAMSNVGTATTISDALYETPVETTNLGSVVVHAQETTLDQMLADRNEYRSGTIKDSYGNVHSYNFTNCTGKILCGFHGHVHRDMYGWSPADVLEVVLDAYAYQTHPFYFINIDKTTEAVNIWKVTDDANVQSHSVSFHEE